MNPNEQQNLQVKESQPTIKVDRTNIHSAIKKIEKDMYKDLRKSLNEIKNKPGKDNITAKEDNARRKK